MHSQHEAAVLKEAAFTQYYSNWTQRTWIQFLPRPNHSLVLSGRLSAKTVPTFYTELQRPWM